MTARISLPVLKGLKKGDIVFGNLEGPFIDNSFPAKCKNKSPYCFEFLIPTRYVAYLRDAGFTTISIANNHTFDCGIKGVDNTISVLRNAGIEAIGGINTARIFLKDKSVVFVGFSFT
jgi:poly-gamma-glutamate capsule biosynthesis protein CapA/YwtB (metallophosphatase superfamily)